MSVKEEQDKTRQDSNNNAKKNSFLVPLDTSWFDADPEHYLAREDFKNFQAVSGVDFRDLLSKDTATVRKAQKQLSDQSIISNEIQKLHFGFGFPFLVYTHCLDFSEPVAVHNPEPDNIILNFDMCDSLRRRHLALSHAIIPQTLRDLHSELQRPLTVKNLGAGVGLDILNAARQMDGAVAAVFNYDTSKEANDLGERIAGHLEDRKEIKPGVIRYRRQSLTESR